MGKATLGIWTEKDKKLASKIKSLRAGEGIKVCDLAKKARITPNTYHRRIKNPEQITISELRTYIKVLKIPKEDILDALYLDKG